MIHPMHDHTMVHPRVNVQTNEEDEGSVEPITMSANRMLPRVLLDPATRSPVKPCSTHQFTHEDLRGCGEMYWRSS
jgi:hypothetical protein